MDDDTDDARAMELYSLEAIYPELARDEHEHEHETYRFTVDVEVKPAQTVRVAFPMPGRPGRDAAPLEGHELVYLPSVRIAFVLPEGYPATQPPQVALSTTPAWLPPDVLERLADDCTVMWDGAGRDQVVFAFVEHVRSLADDAFGLCDAHGSLAGATTDLKVALLDYDGKARQAAFERDTYDCGVCLDRKSGVVCHRMRDCGHVFCRACLRDFYGNAITEGDLDTVRCLAFNCAKERAAALAQDGQRPQRPQRQLVAPDELLEISLDEALVRRYVDLAYKRELELDKTTVYCPRAKCNGAARSDRHRKPEGLVLPSGGMPDTGNGDGEENGEPTKTTADVCVCEECGYAFCSRCLHSWHGYFVSCGPPEPGAMSEEDAVELAKTMAYIARHSTPCPTCDTPVQKTMGCNKMTCGLCHTIFCYLCGAYLNRSNPYSHFSFDAEDESACTGKLWDKEEGDGSDDDTQPPPRLANGRRVPRPQHHHAREAAGAAEAGRRGRVDRGYDAAAAQVPVVVQVAREAPLVLRLNIERAQAVDGEDGANGNGHAHANAQPNRIDEAYYNVHTTWSRRSWR